MYIHPELIIHQVSALEEVMRDSILLCESGGNRDKAGNSLRYLMLDDSNRDLPSQFLITNAEFSLDQLAKIRVALEDTAKIQSTPSGAKVKVGRAGIQL